MTRRVGPLDLPEEWFETTAALALQTAGANSLAKCRPIASLSTMRKIYLDSLSFSAGVQIKTDGFRQRLSREHGRAYVSENWRAAENGTWSATPRSWTRGRRSIMSSHAAALRAMGEMGVGAH